MYVEHEVAPGAEVWAASGVVGDQRILPDGCLDMIFDGTQLLVAGPDTVARVHVERVAVSRVAVRLYAGLGPALLGVPAAELIDRTPTLDQVWGDSRARRLTEQVADDPAAVLRWWVGPGVVDPFGPRLRALLGAGHSVVKAAEALGYSSRQLRRRTIRAFGYGPQHLSRVLRLERAVAAADAGHPWSAIAPVVGYTDQAHLSRDIRDLTGVSPGALRAERVRSVQDVA